ISHQEGMKTTPPDGILRFEVDNVYDRPSLIVLASSSEIEVKGIPWEATAVVTGGGFSGDLRVGLQCNIEQLTLWSIDVHAEFIIIHPDSSQNLSAQIISNFHQFNNRVTHSFFRHFRFVENAKEFIKDNVITIEVRFWISNINGIRYIPRIDFTDPNDPRHDVALIIEGEKIYVSKQV
ncbi:hypothetical protein PMAYCL1PPCAC_25256, partial [Pristionchus mayeri]